MAKRRGPTMVQRSRRVSPQDKAVFHHEVGAGKAGVKRPFLGLTDAELDTIGRRIDQRISVRLERA